MQAKLDGPKFLPRRRSLLNTSLPLPSAMHTTHDILPAQLSRTSRHVHLHTQPNNDNQQPHCFDTINLALTLLARRA